MTVLPKSTVSVRQRQVNVSNAALGPKMGTNSLNHPKGSSRTVTILPSAQRAPVWLLRLERSCSIITGLLVATTLSVYGWTVHCQQSWSQTYRELETLQKNERQLTVSSEMLKNHLGREAEQPTTGLQLPNPATTIFLPSTPVPATTGVGPTKPVAQSKQLTPTPLGY